MTTDPDRQGCAWVEGEYVPVSEARIPIREAMAEHRRKRDDGIILSRKYLEMNAANLAGAGGQWGTAIGLLSRTG